MFLHSISFSFLETEFVSIHHGGLFKQKYFSKGKKKKQPE